MNGWLLLLVMIAAGAVVGIGGVIMGALLGPRNPTPEKSAPYECGMPAVGDARERQSVKFYLVGMIFLLLTAGYIYVWRKGALDWGREK